MVWIPRHVEHFDPWSNGQDLLRDFRPVHLWHDDIRQQQMDRPLRILHGEEGVDRTARLHGYTVLEARHGIEALLASAKYVGPIHLLLTDVVMPQMNGPEVAEKILTVRPGIKVLYMSGYPDHPVFDQGGMSRQIGFLPKPFSPHVLAQKVREVLDSVKAA